MNLGTFSLMFSVNYQILCILYLSLLLCLFEWQMSGQITACSSSRSYFVFCYNFSSLSSNVSSWIYFLYNPIFERDRENYFRILTDNIFNNSMLLCLCCACSPACTVPWWNHPCRIMWNLRWSCFVALPCATWWIRTIFGFVIVIFLVNIYLFIFS